MPTPTPATPMPNPPPPAVSLNSVTAPLTNRLAPSSAPRHRRPFFLHHPRGDQALFGEDIAQRLALNDDKLARLDERRRQQR